MITAKTILFTFCFLLFVVGTIGLIVSSIIERYYTKKLIELNRRLKQDEQWRNKYINNK
jgi:hypothetical protein